MALQLRLANKADAADILTIYAPIVATTPISFETTPPTLPEMEQRLQSTLNQYPWLVCTEGDQVIGYAYGSAHRTRAAYQWAADVSVYVHPQWRRRQIGHALYAALLPILAQQGYYQAYAGIALPNPASVGLHEALGFTPIGVYPAVGYKLGAWHDVGWWVHCLRPPTTEPSAPQPVTTLIDTAAWDIALQAGSSLLRSHELT